MILWNQGNRAKRKNIPGFPANFRERFDAPAEKNIAWTEDISVSTSHVQFVDCIAVFVLCIGFASIGVLAQHIGLVNFYVCFGVLFAQLAAW